MFRVEGGTIVLHAGNSIEKIHTKNISEEKLSDWQKIMNEFDRAQSEMKAFYDKAIEEAHKG